MNEKYEVFDELKARKEDLNKRSEASLNEAEARWFERIADAKKEAEEEMKGKFENFKERQKMKDKEDKCRVLMAIGELGAMAVAVALVSYGIMLMAVETNEQ